MRVAPVALTRGGFVREWLDMDDGEAARWSAAEAARAHKKAVESLGHKALKWAKAFRCRGSVWEIGVGNDDEKQVLFFRMESAHASRLRMLSVSDQPSPACESVDLIHDLKSIVEPLPW